MGRKLVAFGMAGTPLESLPVTLRRAVTLMLSGAAATTLWGILQVVAVIAYRNDSVLANGKKVTTTGAEVATTIVFVLVVTIILAAAWVLMARKNQEGRGWARITASALFLLWSLYCWISIGSTGSTALLFVLLLVTLATWVIGAAALFLLWRPDSTAFYKGARDA
jgi:hypothetical protein